MSRNASSNETRVLRVGWSAEGEEAANDGTRYRSLRAGWLNVKGVFNAHQRQLAGLLRREQRPGLMVFVLGPTEVEGCLWLAATDEPRCATIGRHFNADLYLPTEEALSLRHCLVLVRRVGDGIRVHAVDLGSTAGMQLETGEPARAVEADGHFFLRVPGAVIGCFPTGVELPWNPSAVPAFTTLKGRHVVAALEQPEPIWRQHDSGRESRVTTFAGPVGVSPSELLENGEVPAGILALDSPDAT